MSDKIDRKSIWRETGAFVSRMIRGECILVPISSTTETLDSLFTLNGTAAIIWAMATEGRDAQSIIEKLSDTFQVERGVAARDVDDTIERLVRLGALEQIPQQS